MIIQCPACATRYEVPDQAVGADGRKVRCAKCHHSWRIEAPSDEQVGVEEAALPTQETASEQLGTLQGASDSRSAEPAAVSQAVTTPESLSPEPQFEPQSQTEPQPRLERGPLSEPARDVAPGPARRLLMWAAIILAGMVVTALLVVKVWGMPEWLPAGDPTFAAEAPAGLVLDFPRDEQGWRQLPNGTEIFGASGTITNSGQSEHAVPPILIVLRDAHERAVYSWEVVPPERRLAPGASIAVNEAVTDAPRSAHFADIGWKPR